MARGAATVLVLACLFSLAACAGRAPTPSSPGPARDGDCLTLRVWSNGFHTSLALRAEHLPADHPVRALYPNASHVLIGWGERAYFMKPSPGVFDAVAAITPPSPSALQVMAHTAPVEETLWRPDAIVTVAVSRAGMAALAEALSDAIEVGADGAPIVLGDGRLPGRSVFLAARPGFHLFYMCNHWTADRLADAGVPVRLGPAPTANGLLAAVAAVAPAGCASAPPS